MPERKRVFSHRIGPRIAASRRPMKVTIGQVRKGLSTALGNRTGSVRLIREWNEQVHKRGADPKSVQVDAYSIQSGNIVKIGGSSTFGYTQLTEIIGFLGVIPEREIEKAKKDAIAGLPSRQIVSHLRKKNIGRALKVGHPIRAEKNIKVSVMGREVPVRLEYDPYHRNYRIGFQLGKKDVEVVVKKK